MLTTRLQLLRGLMISGAIILRPIYAFVFGLGRESFDFPSLFGVCFPYAAPMYDGFRCARKIAKSDCELRHVCLSVRIELLGTHWTDFHKNLYLRIFRKSIEKIKVSLNSEINKGYLT